MKKNKERQDISTLIGSKTKIKGTIEFEGAIRLDGDFEGNLLGPEGSVIVGQTAVIKGDMKVGYVMIMGDVHGNIEATSKIEIHPPGRMIGDIKAPNVLIDPGVVFNGKCIVVKPKDDSF